ncbi:hypothetical protein HK100_003071, partial [Physocladia obscura]
MSSRSDTAKLASFTDHVATSPTTALITKNDLPISITPTSRVDSEETIQNDPNEKLSRANTSSSSLSRTAKHPKQISLNNDLITIQSNKLADRSKTQQNIPKRETGAIAGRGGSIGLLGSKNMSSKFGSIVTTAKAGFQNIESDSSKLEEKLSTLTLFNETAPPVYKQSSLLQLYDAQPVPPPIKIKKSLYAFPQLQFSRPSTSEKITVSTDQPESSNNNIGNGTIKNAFEIESPKKSPQRSNSVTSQRLNKWRASATDFFAGLVKKRGHSVSTCEGPDEDTGGEAVEEILKPSTAAVAAVTKNKASKTVARVRGTAIAVVESAHRVGERLVSAGKNQYQRAATALMKPAAQSSFGRLPTPPAQQQQDQQQDRISIESARPGILSLKEREEEERESRSADMTAFINGSKKLPPEFSENYKLGEILGDGAFGFVISAISLKDEIEVAVKFISRNKIPRELWVKDVTSPLKEIPIEISILQQIKHPNIIRYINHIVESTKYILLITELHGSEWKPQVTPSNVVEIPQFKIGSSNSQEKQIRRRTSCDLFECIDAHRRIPEKLAKKIFAQIALAVEYLHSQGLVHRDLKDENIVIDKNYDIKIIDFGSVAQIPTDVRDYFTKFNGTLHFASPEVSNGFPYRGPEAEMWAMGVLLYTIVYGENPYHTREDILRGDCNCPANLESDSQPE